MYLYVFKKSLKLKNRRLSHDSYIYPNANNNKNKPKNCSCVSYGNINYKFHVKKYVHCSIKWFKMRQKVRNNIESMNNHKAQQYKFRRFERPTPRVFQNTYIYPCFHSQFPLEFSTKLWKLNVSDNVFILIFQKIAMVKFILFWIDQLS